MAVEDGQAATMDSSDLKRADDRPAFEPTFDLHTGGGARPQRSSHRLPLGDLPLQFAREIRVDGFRFVLRISVICIVFPVSGGGPLDRP
jgi:hypothetical protein